MLTSCKLTGSAEAISRYHTQEENYYFSQASGGEALGERDDSRGHVHIHGKLAGQLGLKPGHEISEQAFTNLLSGKNAAGDKICREHKVMGIDLTFSAPKSLSVAALVTLRDARLIEAHDRSVLETMREIEAQHAAAQPRPGECVPTGNLAYVTARDGYSREHDPHLHTHVVVMNLTECGGKIMALDGRQIMARDFNKMWGALYRANLAAHVQELGYSVSYTKKGELRLDAVSLELEREFSSRGAQIEAAEAAGARHMEAWRKTRKDKNPEVAQGTVREAWESRLAKYSVKTAEQTRKDTVLAREQWYKDATWSVEARQELAGERLQTEAARWQAAARRATERTARASRQALITEYLSERARAETWEPITFTQAAQFLEAQARAGNILATDDGFYTTWELARADRECAREPGAEKVKLALGAPAAAKRVTANSEAASKAGRRRLSGPQVAVATQILSAERGTVIVQGDAGSGKTTLLKAVREVATFEGWEVRGVAVQGVAARKLQEESGIASTTLSSYLSSGRNREKASAPEARPANRGPRLVVVDEASMLDSRGLAELLRDARAHGDKVVLVGDRNQLESVGAGKPFERLVAAAEASKELLNLSENYRQRDAKLREAVDLARQGRMRDSLDLLLRTDRIEEVENPNERRQVIARLYDKDTLVVTGSREGRDELNRLIRRELEQRGDLPADEARRYRLSRADEDGIKRSVTRQFAKGERVVFLENEYAHYDVRNGEIGTVTETGKDTLGVALEDGRRIELDLARYGALDYGYALTTYKSQGQTYDKVLVEADTTAPQLQDQRNTYVQITRARDNVRIFTDDYAELRNLAGVLSVKADTHDLDVTLEKARLMEAKVREEALGLRARQEAAVKIAQAEAAARKDALSVSEVLLAAKDGAPLHAGEASVHNKAYMAEVVGNGLWTEAFEKHLRETEELLKKSVALSEGEKHRVAEYLRRDEAAALLSACNLSAERTIAAALVASGTRRLDEATKGMSDDARTDVSDALAMAADLNEKSLMSSAENKLDKGFGLDLTPDI